MRLAGGAKTTNSGEHSDPSTPVSRLCGIYTGKLCTKGGGSWWAHRYPPHWILLFLVTDLLYPFMT